MTKQIHIELESGKAIPEEEERPHYGRLALSFLLWFAVGFAATSAVQMLVFPGSTDANAEPLDPLMDGMDAWQTNIMTGRHRSIAHWDDPTMDPGFFDLDKPAQGRRLSEGGVESIAQRLRTGIKDLISKWTSSSKVEEEPDVTLA